MRQPFEPMLELLVVHTPSPTEFTFQVSSKLGHSEQGELTVTVTLAVPVAPQEFVPVTGYVVVEVGLTVILLPVLPLLQEYELAPEAVKVVLSP